MQLPNISKNPQTLLIWGAIILVASYLFFSSTDIGRQITALIQQNLTFILIVVLLGIIAYFVLIRKKEAVWRSARDSFRNAVVNRHLAIPHGFRTWQEIWNTCRPPNRLESHGGWAFTGQVMEKGKLDTVIIGALDDKGWVLNGISGAVEYGHTNVQKMERKGLKLEEGLLESARKGLELEKAVKGAKETAREEASS